MHVPNGITALIIFSQVDFLIIQGSENTCIYILLEEEKCQNSLQVNYNST